MAKQSLTLNGFGGGLNVDADESDLVANGEDQDEVSYIQDLFLDRRGKIVGEYPTITTDGSTTQVTGNNTSAESILVHDSNLYQQTGIFKIGDDISWTGKGDYLVHSPITGSLNGTPDSTTSNPQGVRPYGVDMQTSTDKSDVYHLFLGYNAASNVADSAGNKYARLFQGTDSLANIDHFIRQSNDENADGETETANYFEILDTINDDAVDNHEVKLWDADTSPSLIDLDDGVTFDPNSSGNIADFFAIHNAEATNDQSVGISFRVGDADLAGNSESPRILGGRGYVSFPSESFQNRTLKFEIYVASTVQLKGIYFVADSHQTNSHYKYDSDDTDDYGKMWMITPSMIASEGGSGSWNTYEIEYDNSVWEGASYNYAGIKQFHLIAQWDGDDHQNTSTNGVIRIREISFWPTGERYLWANEEFKMYQTMINAKDMESLFVSYPAEGRSVTTFKGYNAPQTFTVYRPHSDTSNLNLGGRLYLEKLNSNEAASEGSLFLLAEWDYTDGVKTVLSADFEPWVSSKFTFSLDSPPIISTYTAKSGVSEDTTSLNAIWNTASTIGRQSYIGNCAKQTNQVVISTSSGYETLISDVSGDGYVRRLRMPWTGKAQAHITVDSSPNPGNDNTFLVTDTNGVSDTYVAKSGVATRDGSLDGSNIIFGYSDIAGNASNIRDAFVTLVNTHGTAAITALANQDIGSDETFTLRQDNPGSAGNTVITSSFANWTVLTTDNPYRGCSTTGFELGSDNYITAGEYVAFSGGTGFDGIYQAKSTTAAAFLTTGAASATATPGISGSTQNPYDNDLVLTTVPGGSGETCDEKLIYATSFGAYEPSLILKSVVDKPGLYSDKAYIDLEFGGETIKVIETVGDRLFVFTGSSLTIINVAQDVEFIEATLNGMGVSHHRQVVKINELLAFVNGSGVHFFDGEKIINASDEKLRTVDWHVSNSAISYDAARKLVIVWKDDDEQYYFDMPTKTFIGYTNIASQHPVTNTFIKSNKVSTFRISGGLRTLGTSTASASDANRKVQLVTGKISCGNLAQLKNFYKLYLTAENAENLDVWIRTDQSADDLYQKVFDSDTANLSDGENIISLRSSGLLSASTKGKWIQIKLLADNNNCNSDIVIKDMSITFRGRQIK